MVGKRYSKDPFFSKIKERITAQSDKNAMMSDLSKRKKQIKAAVVQILGGMQGASQTAVAES